MHQFSPRGQAVRRHDVFHQVHQVHRFASHRAVGLFSVVVQQLFNQLLQVTTTAVEDLDDLVLLRGQWPGDPVGQQLGTFTHTGQRGFQLMRQMTKKLMPLRLQPRQALAEPDDALAHRAQLARAGKQCGVVQRLPCPQLIDHSFYAFHRTDNHAGEEQHQRQAQQKQHQRLPAEKLAAFGNLLLQLLAAEKVTVGFGVPVIWAGLLAAMRRTEVRLPEFKRALVGGSALPPSMAEAFQRDYGIELTHAWGMTETSPIGTINTPLSKHDALPAQEQQKQRAGQGRPIFGIELQVVDVDGEPLPRDGQSQGYLQVRGHWVVEQYYGQDASALTAGGWFDTGDIGTLDANGYLVICDRAKDIIKSGGEWISTVELENIAIAHPAVRSAAAIAARHPRWDERPVLLCVRAEGGEVEETDLLTWFETRVPKWQIPDRVIFVDALPVSATGKVLKNQLRQAHGEILMSEGK